MVKKEYFVDSSAFIALIYEDDQYHDEALSAFKQSMFYSPAEEKPNLVVIISKIVTNDRPLRTTS